MLPAVLDKMQRVTSGNTSCVANHPHLPGRGVAAVAEPKFVPVGRQGGLQGKLIYFDMDTEHIFDSNAIHPASTGTQIGF